MIACSECGKQISDTAKNCVGCGARVHKAIIKNVNVPTTPIPPNLARIAKKIKNRSMNIKTSNNYSLSEVYLLLKSEFKLSSIRSIQFHGNSITVSGSFLNFVIFKDGNELYYNGKYYYPAIFWVYLFVLPIIGIFIWLVRGEAEANAFYKFLTDTL